MTRPRCLLGDDTGAIALLGLLMAVLLAGLMYSLVGLGDAIVQRERMQDAADAAALSGAVIHARGMNTLVLVNMIMAAFLAILVALKLTEAIVGVAMIVCYAISIFTPAAIPVAEGLRQTRSTIAQAHGQLQPPIHETLRTLHAVSRGVRVVVPWGAQASVTELVRAHYAPPARVGFLLPPAPTLPTEDGEFPELCDHAGDLVGELASLPFASVGLGEVRDVIDDAVADLAHAGASWFCGDGSTAPPRHHAHFAHALPVLPARQACLDYGPDDAGFREDEGAHLCQLADAEEQAAAVDPDSGECLQQCGRDQPFDLRVTRARTDCDPASGDDLRAFRWQQRTVERSWVLDRGGWQLVSQHAGPPRRIARGEDDRTHPCGPGGVVSDGYETTPWVDATGMEPRPVCSDARRPPAGGSLGQRFVDRATEVLQLLGCTRHASREIAIEAAAGDPSRDTTETERGAMAPQRLRRGLQLGTDGFQLRAAVLGALPDAGMATAVKAAGWRDGGGADAPASQVSVPLELLAEARRLGGLSLAQAEHYYDVTDPSRPDAASWMWNMRWRARLRRLRVPDDGHASDASGDLERFGLGAGAATAEEACRLALRDADTEDDPCTLAAALDGKLLEELEQWLVH